jgi:hypothetical protein
MPFQTRRSTTLAPEKIIKLLIPSMDMTTPPSPAHSGSGRRRSRNQCRISMSYPMEISIIYSHSHIQDLFLNIQDLSTFPLIYNAIHEWDSYPILIHIHIFITHAYIFKTYSHIHLSIDTQIWERYSTLIYIHISITYSLIFKTYLL